MPPVADPSTDRGRYVRTMLTAGAVSTAVWLWFQLDLLDQRIFGNFYDIQARALLDGHLDVPAGSLGNEAFLFRGHEYLYNPPGPSLLRLPLFLVTDRFDGRLTVISMLLAWILTLGLMTALIWRVRRLVRGSAPLPVWEAVAYGVLLAAATLGTTLLYVGSVPWVFHEAYAWAVPMALGSAYCLLGLIEVPSVGGAVSTGLFTLGAVLTRSTAGWACAFAVLVAAAWIGRGGRGDNARPLWWGIGLAGAVPVLIGVAVNWAKFRHPYAFPIENQVFTALSESRRETLAATGGDGFSPDVVRATLPAYLRPDGIRFTSVFPFLSLPAHPAPEYGVVLDRSYRTGSIVAFMPVLVTLAVVGTVTAFRRGASTGAALLRLPLLGMALIPGAVVFGAYITHRYTAEFLPFLLTGSALGAVEVARRVGPVAPRARRGVLAGLGVLAAFGVAANLAVGVQAQAMANPGPVLAHHVARQARISSWTGDPIDGRVVASVQLPAEGRTDELRIVGECQALYLGTGEQYSPWVEVANRRLALRFTVAQERPDLTAPLVLAEFLGHRHTELALERAPEGLRLVLQGGGVAEEGPWMEDDVGSAFDVTIATDQSDEYVISVLGEPVLTLPKESLDSEFVALPNVLLPAPLTTAGDLGLLAAEESTPSLATCETLRRRYLEHVADS